MNSLDGLMIVGLTGQTGAGKSTVSRIFSENGFKVINADIIARKVVEKGTPCLAEISDYFGLSILNADVLSDTTAEIRVSKADSKKLYYVLSCR